MQAVPTSNAFNYTCPHALHLRSLPTLPTDTMDAGLPGVLTSPWAETTLGERGPPEKLPKARRGACGEVFPAAKDSFKA